MLDITNPVFTNEEKARKFLEAQRWPDGPVCPHCKSGKLVRPVPPELMKTKPSKKNPNPRPRKGWHYCRPCRQRFTVRTGTLYERSHVPLHKWLLATHLICASKKSISTKQLERMLGLSYKSAWFVGHRVREGMDVTASGPIGGQNKVVESDETFIGGKAKNVHNGKPIPKKHPVVALVERDGEVRAKHVADVTAKNVREHLVTSATRDSYLMSDESNVYKKVGKEFKGHASVNHSADEYVRLGGFVHVNTAESFFALVKRSIYGAHHAVSEQHLQRYINEMAFRWNHRIALGYDDQARTLAALKGIEGKRLYYRRPRSAENA